jgi:hypothetical protein
MKKPFLGSTILFKARFSDATDFLAHVVVSGGFADGTLELSRSAEAERAQC